MDGAFRSPSSKRSRANGSSGGAGNGASSKRFKPPPPPLTIGAGNVLFRLLCPTPLSGGVIGKSGTIVKQLQQDTASKIRVEESPPGVDDRVIVIIASKSASKKIALTDLKGENEGGRGVNEEVVEVSAAQEAVIRVFERIIEVMGETEGVVAPAPGGVVSCRLLAEISQVGGVIGKGGKVIEKIRKDTECKVRVWNQGKLPACALPNEEMLEMEGNVLAVKRALLAITSRLQDCPPLETGKMSVSRPFQTIPHRNLPNFHVGLPPDRIPVVPARSYPYASRGRPFSTEVDRAPALDSRTKQEEVVFRFLCSNDRVGGVIGKGGTIVKALQNETGASINVGGSVAGCDERLITITATENLESQFSPAQNAVVLVFNRSIEAGFEKGLDSATSKNVSARVVVPSNQVGCLMGKGGTIISEMRMATGAGIRIVGHDQLPKCASENDEVVEITGEFVNVQDALFKVTSRLRENLFPHRMPNGAGSRTNSSMMSEMSLYERAIDPLHMAVGVSPAVNPHTVLPQNMDYPGLPHSYDRPPSSMPWASQAVGGVNPRGVMDVGSGLTSVKGGLELGSGSRSAIVTNTTVEIVVPNDVIGSVYGENGSNLARLRQISGAKVAVHEPRPGTADWTIVISGTPDETQAAQSLIQAFILTGPA